MKSVGMILERKLESIREIFPQMSFKKFQKWKKEKQFLTKSIENITKREVKMKGRMKKKKDLEEVGDRKSETKVEGSSQGVAE